MLSKFYLFMLLFVFTSALMVHADQSPNVFNFSARIIKPNGSPLEANPVAFRFTVLSPIVAPACILYIEDYPNINMTGSFGYVNIAIGSGTRFYPTSGKMTDVFNNSSSGFNCQGGGSYVPAASDQRRVVTQFNDGSGWQSLSATVVSAIPWAKYSDVASDTLSLGGVLAPNYVKKADIPNCSAANQFLKYDTGTSSWSCATATGTGTVTSVATGTGLTGGPITTSGTLAVDVGTTNGKIAQVGAGDKLPISIIPNLPASQITTGVLAPARLGTGTADNTKYLAGDGTWTTLPAGNAGTVTSVASGTGLTGGPITSSGTISVDVGTTASKIVQLDGSAKLPAVDGSQLTGITTKLSSLGAANATNTIDNTNYAQAWDWSTATTQNPISLTANALTTGSVLSITSSNNTLNSTNGLLNVANTGISTNGVVARIQSNSTAGSGLTVLANGNVGIGTASPYSKLHVIGVSSVGTPMLRFEGDTGAGFNFYSLANSAILRASSGKSILVQDNDGSNPGYFLAETSDKSVRLGTNAIERMRIDASGNVGIGTTTPVSKLQLGSAPTATANYPHFALGTAPFDGTTVGYFTGNSNGTFIGINATSGYLGDFLNFQIAGATKFKVDKDGNYSGTGNSVSTGNISTSGNISTTGTGTITSNGQLTANSGTASTSPMTGSLVVSGGAGISGALNVGTNITANGNISTSANTAATAGNNYSSPYLYLTANYWNGAATAVDTWSIQNILGTGANPTSTLQFGHTGTPGPTQYAFMNGNVGIGTTVPTTTLHTYHQAPTGTISTSGTTVTGVGTNFTQVFKVGDQFISREDSRVITSIPSDTSLTIDSGFVPNRIVGSNYNNVGAIFDSGNVGIGTNIPKYKLEVSSDQRIGISSSGTKSETDGQNQVGIISYDKFAPTVNTVNAMSIAGWSSFAPPAGVTINNGIMLGTSSGGANLGAGTITNGYGLFISNPTFATNNYAAYFGGRVGIGTATPRRALHIAGAPSSEIALTDSSQPVDSRTFRFMNNGQLFSLGAVDDAMVLEPQRVFTATRTGFFGLGGTFLPTQPLQMVSGAYVTAAGVWTNASDARLKKNIVDTNYGLDQLLQLRSVEYDMKKTGDHQVGFIAQEVQKIIPEVVSGKEGDVEKGETLGISYGNLVPVVVNAIKQIYSKVLGQDQIIEQQKLDITNLKAENEQLKRRLEKIEKAIGSK